MIVYAPLASVTALRVPSLTVTPAMGAPPLAVTWPLIEYVPGAAVPVKFCPLTSAPLTVTLAEVGVKVYPPKLVSRQF